MLRVPSLSVTTAHVCAVRLCGLVYFFAFVGNIVDGPIMWLIDPPSGGYDADGLIRLNVLGCVAGLIVVFRPWWWPALVVAWPIWHVTQKNGGFWFHFGWDSMMDEVGFLSLLLAVTLTLYDDLAFEEGEEAEILSQQALRSTVEHDSDAKLNAASHAGQSSQADIKHGDEATAAASTLRARKQNATDSPEPMNSSNKASATANVPTTTTEGIRELLSSPVKQMKQLPLIEYWGTVWGTTHRPNLHMEPSSPIVDCVRCLAELSLTLAAFRLFVAAGLLKKRVGSPCWSDHTCLFDHYETQPMPNAAAWYFHTFTPKPLLRMFQMFAIDLAECAVPWLLLSFVLTMGPLGLLHRRLCKHEQWQVRCLVRFPGRFIGAVIILLFVLGMFVGGNYAFLHPLSVVALVASMGTVRGTPMAYNGVYFGSPAGDTQGRAAQVALTAKLWYRRVVPWLLVPLFIFAFLPSLRAYAWIANFNESTGRLEGLMDSAFVTKARRMNLGIPYNHHAYFAGAVHKRNEFVLFADLGDGYVELDVPFKVGRPDRHPAHTSPLHRRFAWEWWFLGLGADSTWLDGFMYHLCKGNKVAWNAVEHEFHGQLANKVSGVRSVGAKIFRYHFAPRGSKTWWTRAAQNNYMDVDYSCKDLIAGMSES